MAKLTIIPTSQYKRDIRRINKQGKDISLMNKVIGMLADCEMLPAKYRDHELKGKWRGFRECHIAPDWLLIYKTNDNMLVLTLSRTGSHSELFEE